MPSSLIVVALVVAWLLVLVPMIVRKRQTIARTADSALAARVVRKGGAEEADMRDEDSDSATEHNDPLDTEDEPGDGEPVRPAAAEPLQPRRYRPGRGGFDPEAAALTARAKYATRQRVVVAMLLLAVASAIVAAVAYPMAWWGHGLIDVGLVGYLSYLRRQVRIEEEIRERRLARMAQARRASREYDRMDDEQPVEERPAAVAVAAPSAPPRITHPHAVVVDLDDEDPAFDELEDLDSLRYRRAVGE
ncbi:MAG: gephyrin-like molybdotransferase receptor GlpR [Kibdelosporangium sp.]